MADSKYSPASTKRKDLANVRDGKMTPKRFSEIHGVMPDAVVRTYGGKKASAVCKIYAIFYED